MLILEVTICEKVYIGDDIVLTFINYKGQDKIRLGFDAPRDIEIDREKIRRSKEATGESNLQARRSRNRDGQRQRR